MHSCFAGGHVPEDVHAGRQKILVEKHQDDDHHRRGRAHHRHPHHSVCYQSHMMVTSLFVKESNVPKGLIKQASVRTLRFIPTIGKIFVKLLMGQLSKNR